jgi:hypothetical protein
MTLFSEPAVAIAHMLFRLNDESWADIPDDIRVVR